MSGQGSQVKCLNLVQLCVQVGAVSRRATHQLLPPRWRGESATVRLSSRRSPTAGDWLSNVGVQGVKGDKLLAEGGDASNGWLRSGFSAKARKRRELEPAKTC
jgi:hypothetical protein